MEPQKERAATLQLQPRDVALLRGLFESRIMTSAHIGTLFFNGKSPYAKKRVQRMKVAGLIGERKRNANEKSVLFLTRKGFGFLRTAGHISEYPYLSGDVFEARADVSATTLQHEIEIMDVKAAFHGTLAKAERFSLQKFHTWPRLYEFEVTRNGYGSEVLVRPDGFICIHEREGDNDGYAHDFFLEVDRSSESQEILVEKAVRYLEFYKSGGFAVRNGGTPTDFKDFPFRVLVVLKNAERRNNLAERLVQNNPPILTQTWLTTLAEVTADPLGAIWIQPKDYREATRGTAFDTDKPVRSLAYRRQEERERLVESKVKKNPLLDH